MEYELIESVKVLNIRDGDILVINLKQKIHKAHEEIVKNDIKSLFSEHFGNVKVLLVDPDIELSVIRKEDDNS